jgi:6-phosphogluconolactonase (cycloisomerase 2 family)
MRRTLFILGATLWMAACGGLPTITKQPANVTVAIHSTATFTVTATGSGTLTYQWQLNGQNIAGATSASYTTPATTTVDDGSVFNVVVSDHGGSVTSNGATLTVQSNEALFAYGSDTAHNQLLVYTVDLSSGALTPAPTASYSLSATPAPTPVLNVNDQFLYVGCNGAIAGFNLLPDGTLTPLSGSPFATPGLSGLSLAATPDGQYLYESGNGAPSIFAFQIGIDGNLAALSGSPFAFNDLGVLPIIQVASQILFATTSVDDNVATFALTDGTVSRGDQQDSDVQAEVFDFVPTQDGQHAYAADTTGVVAVYNVDSDSGLLTAATNVSIAAGDPAASLLSPDGNNLYVVDTHGRLATFAVSSDDGSLSPPVTNVEGDAYAAQFMRGVIDPGERFIYLLNAAVSNTTPTHDVLIFSLDSTTGAVDFPGTPVGLGTQLADLAFVQQLD